MDRGCSDDSEIEQERAGKGAGPTGGGPEQEDRDFGTQELAHEKQTQLWELIKFEPIGTHQEEIDKIFCRFQIRE